MVNQVNYSSHYYDETFFDYIERGSRRSAAVMVPLLSTNLPVRSVLDIGCGRGVWLAEWLRCGITDIQGVDGDYVRKDRLMIPTERFTTADLSQPFSLGQRYDVVQCLEVAEHIPVQYEDNLIENLSAHGDLIVFSAAVPGQGGEHHVNEQTYEHWRKKFAAHGYRVFDFLRPRLRSNRQIEPWYRYNTMMFARSAAADALPAPVAAAELLDRMPVPDLAPPLWHLRNAVLRQLPVAVVSGLAKVKHGILCRLHALQAGAIK